VLRELIKKSEVQRNENKNKAGSTRAMLSNCGEARNDASRESYRAEKHSEPLGADNLMPNKKHVVVGEAPPRRILLTEIVVAGRSQ